MAWGRKEHSSSGKKAAHKARGVRTPCSCGVMTFSNHLSGHLKSGKHQARLVQKAQDKVAMTKELEARRQRKKRVAREYAQKQLRY
jgi:hypothetical protein